MELTLFVLRVADLNASATFYRALGMSLRQERHGQGPIHYSFQLSHAVFELYPADTQVSSNVRLAFTVPDLQQHLAAAAAAGFLATSRSARGARFVDPDGNLVVLREKQQGDAPGPPSLKEPASP